MSCRTCWYTKKMPHHHQPQFWGQFWMPWPRCPKDDQRRLGWLHICLVIFMAGAALMSWILFPGTIRQLAPSCTPIGAVVYGQQCQGALTVDLGDWHGESSGPRRSLRTKGPLFARGLRPAKTAIVRLSAWKAAGIVKDAPQAGNPRMTRSRTCWALICTRLI